MRGLIGVLALLAMVLPHQARPQMQEEVLEVPTSGATRNAEQAEIDAEAEEEAARETAEPESGEAMEAEPEPPEPAEAAEADRQWRDIAAPYDIERIEANEADYGRMLEVARRVGSEADQAELARILADLPQPFGDEDLTGRWQCRTVRFTEDPARLKIYDRFDCQITELSAGLLLEKLTGSELSGGYLYPDSETRMIYLGYRHGRNEPARDYDGPEGTTGKDPGNRDDPGILTRRGPDRLLLAKPSPVVDSDYDLLEFRRP